MRTVSWQGITAQIMDGESPEGAMIRKVKKIHGARHTLHRDSFNDGAGPLYRLAESRGDGLHLFGPMARLVVN